MKMLYFDWIISDDYFLAIHSQSWQLVTIPSDGNYASLKRFPACTIPVESIFPRCSTNNNLRKS